MKKLSKTEIEKREASSNKLLPNDSWTVVLNGEAKEYAAALSFILRFYRALKDAEESARKSSKGNSKTGSMFDKDIPQHYVALATQFKDLMGVIENAL